MFCIRIYSDDSDFLRMCIARGSVAMRLRCNGRFNKHVITNLWQSVAVKTFLKSVNIWRRCGQWESGTFSKHRVVDLLLRYSIYPSINHSINDLFGSAPQVQDFAYKI